MSNECMDYPASAEEFIKGYSFKDSKEVYTNGSILVPLFRVEQMLEHYFTDKYKTPLKSKISDFKYPNDK